jgi:hypothetical protein
MTEWTKKMQCHTQNCKSRVTHEHEEEYYCQRHYYTIIKGQEWVKKHERFMPQIKSKDVHNDTANDILD